MAKPFIVSQAHTKTTAHFVAIRLNNTMRAERVSPPLFWFLLFCFDFPFVTINFRGKDVVIHTHTISAQCDNDSQEFQ